MSAVAAVMREEHSGRPIRSQYDVSPQWGGPCAEQPGCWMRASEGAGGMPGRSVAVCWTKGLVDLALDVVDIESHPRLKA
ncbi:hypothetical protein [Leucobacter sp. wl10]|uniref:hypothetical protein n=1 Tax=Leucobacter sp. wl10 TaxID=2304677 RepID=UPI0013C355A4|nr:hypothetical protein [Leucobacter sp. wl10]